MFPITINGNTLDKSKVEPLKTKYILVQCRTRLRPSDRQELGNTGVKHLNYVSKNTYLCQYQDGDLEKIRQLEPVVYVDFYHKIFKITPSLKKAIQDEATRNKAFEVDIVFHESVDTNSQGLQKDIKDASRCRVGDKFLPDKVRLTVQGLYLQAVASIDDVRHIEEVGEDVELNDVAREILIYTRDMGK